LWQQARFHLRHQIAECRRLGGHASLRNELACVPVFGGKSFEFRCLRQGLRPVEEGCRSNVSSKPEGLMASKCCLPWAFPRVGTESSGLLLLRRGPRIPAVRNRGIGLPPFEPLQLSAYLGKLQGTFPVHRPGKRVPQDPAVKRKVLRERRHTGSSHHPRRSVWRPRQAGRL
jgi:hypothetical protein